MAERVDLSAEAAIVGHDQIDTQGDRERGDMPILAIDTGQDKETVTGILVGASPRGDLTPTVTGRWCLEFDLSIISWGGTRHLPVGSVT